MLGLCVCRFLAFFLMVTGGLLQLQSAHPYSRKEEGRRDKGKGGEGNWKGWHKFFRKFKCPPNVFPHILQTRIFSSTHSFGLHNLTEPFVRCFNNNMRGTKRGGTESFLQCADGSRILTWEMDYGSPLYSKWTIARRLFVASSLYTYLCLGLRERM